VPPEPSDERTALQAVAFGRGEHSAEERDAAIVRLRELDSRDHEPTVAEETRDDPEIPPLAARSERSRRRRVVFGVLAAVAVVATIGTLGMVQRQQQSLSVFDQPQTAADRDAPDLIRMGYAPEDLRLLDGGGDYQVWGYAGPAPVDHHQDAVCLFVYMSPTSSSGTCTNRSDFVRQGLDLGNFDLGSDPDGTVHTVRFFWGPTGPLVAKEFTVVPDTIEDTFQREPTDADRAGQAYLVSESDTARNSARWVGQYRGVQLWIYRSGDVVCALAANPSDAVGPVASLCTPPDNFEESGITLDWAPDALRFELDPHLNLSIAALPAG
jgi:hypothetical protein